jgi:hypothetical protein
MKRCNSPFDHNYGCTLEPFHVGVHVNVYAGKAWWGSVEFPFTGEREREPWQPPDLSWIEFERIPW